MARWKAKNPERAKELHRLSYQKRKIAWRERELKNEYGLTLAEVDAMKQAQGGKCLICDREASLVVDHCHVSGQVRGLLCNRCNIGLGHFTDDPALLRVAALYLERK
jgi:hypothetical protein